jgi:hypothetical protein
MAYINGGTISATDYNGLAQTNTANVAWVWGVGFGANGYGQSTTGISTLSTGTVVTATQWAGLFNIINRCLGHQGQTQLMGGGNINAVAGAVITYWSNVSSSVTTINNNAAGFGSQGGTTTGTNDATNPTAAATVALNYFRDVNVTFSSANAARYFFNAGGQINFVCSATDNAGTSRSTTLRDMINQVGGLSAFRNNQNGGRSGTGGTIVANVTTFGYRSLTASAQTVVDNNVAGVYSAHDVKIQLFTNSLDTTNGARGASVVFRLLISAAADDTFGGSINLTVNVRADVVAPETTYLTNVWGTPTITFDST